MGLLERWDRRNQDTLEWHQSLENDRRRGVAKTASVSVLGCIAIAIGVRVGWRVLDALVGFGWTMAIMVSIIVIGLTVVVIQARASRRRWLDQREGGPSSGAPS